MSHVDIQNVSKRFGNFEAIKNLSLSVEQAQFCALLGPSGCGKSTLLRMIAGLETVSGGRIHINGKDVTNTPPAKREIAMVFQSYALYPHMSVEQNIAFSMDIAGVPKAQAKERALEIARLLQLEPLLERRPSQLSGGQRQRVAIGRALVRDPQVFLLDEPLSNLDAMLRGQMRFELARLHQELNTTMIYVTHDQIEAMTLADKIVVLDQGEISQIGSPLELYNSPENKFVASFIGSPTMNFVPVELSGRTGLDARVEVPGGNPVSVQMRHGKASADATALELGIRPEHLILTDPGDPEACLKGTVQVIERLGNATVLYINSSAGPIVAQDVGDRNVTTGDAVGLTFDTRRTHLFGADAQVL